MAWTRRANFDGRAELYYLDDAPANRTAPTTQAEMDAFHAGNRLAFGVREHLHLHPETLERVRTYNVVKKPRPIPGARDVKIQEAGLREFQYFPFKFQIEAGAAPAVINDAVWKFPQLRKVTDRFPFGRVGLWYPAFPAFGYRPDATTGLIIEAVRERHLPVARRLEVTYTLVVGGTERAAA